MAAILFLIVWIGAAAVVGAVVPRWWVKIIGVLVVLLVPTADHLWGSYHLAYLCKKDAGLKVYRVVENVDGIYIEDGGPAREFFELGYQFVEGREGGQYLRLERTDSPTKPSLVKAPSALYVARHDRQDSSMYSYSRLTIKDRQTGELLGEYTDIAFYGGWAVHLLAMFSDAGSPSDPATCAQPHVWNRRVSLLKAVLHPTQ